jgi:hypothetical protein
MPIPHQQDPPSSSRPLDHTHHMVVCCVGARHRRALVEGARVLQTLVGCSQQILEVD